MNRAARREGAKKARRIGRARPRGWLMRLAALFWGAAE
jgi:hypothetical protein